MDELKAMGYTFNTEECVSVPGVGGMGVHVINFQFNEDQFPKGEMDPKNPVAVLLDAGQQKVIGLEWEAKDVGQGEMELFGVPIKLQRGHPGIPEPHYMLHVYFKPGGQVLMLGADPNFDPDLTCPAGMPDTGAGGTARSGNSWGLLWASLVSVVTLVLVWGVGLVRRPRTPRER